MSEEDATLIGGKGYPSSYSASISHVSMPLTFRTGSSTPPVVR